MRGRFIGALLACIALAAPALARPPAPPEAERAAPGRDGWFVAEDSGCWVWGEQFPATTILRFAGPCPAGPAEGPGQGSWHLRAEGRDRSYRFGGTLRNGRLYGLGWYDYGEGGRYEGAFRSNQFHGHGVYVWENGDRYDGQWRGHLPDGPGIFATATEAWQGHWREGCLFDGARVVVALARDDEECAALAPAAK